MCTFLSRGRTPSGYPGPSERNLARSGVEVVVEPLLAHAAHAVVETLGGVVVERRLPLQRHRSVLADGVEASGDQGRPHPAAARPGRGEEVVHQADASRARGRPEAEDGGESERSAVLVARDELNAFALGVRDQGARHREQRLVRRVDLVEVAVAAHERKQVVEAGLADAGDRDGHFDRCAPLTAAAAPSPTSTVPVTQRSTCAASGRALSQPAAEPDASAQTLSDSSAITTNNVPSTSAWSVTEPRPGSRNCGRNA